MIELVTDESMRLFFLLKFQSPVTLCSGELWSILVVRLAHSANLRSQLRVLVKLRGELCATGLGSCLSEKSRNWPWSNYVWWGFGGDSGRLRIRWVLCVESIHDRSIKLENQVGRIQREWIDSMAGLWISSESSSWHPAAKIVLEGVTIFLFTTFVRTRERFRQGRMQYH